VRTKGSAQQLESIRKLAVQRVREGWSPREVADFLKIHPRTLRQWRANYRADPAHGLDSQPHPGRPRKLSAEQEALVLSWFSKSATAFGFPTELWTADRVAVLIERFFAVRFNPRYLSAWLAQRRITPQKPQFQPRERNQAAIDQWLAEDWPALKKTFASSRLP
jgi:transposase